MGVFSLSPPPLVSQVRRAKQIEAKPGFITRTATFSSSARPHFSNFFFLNQRWSTEPFVMGGHIKSSVCLAPSSLMSPLCAPLIHCPGCCCPALSLCLPLLSSLGGWVTSLVSSKVQSCRLRPSSLYSSLSASSSSALHMKHR